MTYTLFTPNPARATLPSQLHGGGNPQAFHAQLPGYGPTPLWDCPAVAEALGVARVLVKDESSRLGLPSFKMLGASWATARAIQRHWLDGGLDGEAGAPQLNQLRTDLAASSGRRLVAATDGNHGRGVARMAAMLGLGCAIFVPAGTAGARIRSIESEGATVEVVEGSYDDAIARSAQEADGDSLVISDTSWEGYVQTPSDVVHGYSTLFLEIDQALARSSRPSPGVLALQAGVGSFAAAGLAHYGSPGSALRTSARRTTAQRPRTVVVEPVAANCLMRSAQSGGITEAPGPHRSTMAGLNCGLPSMLAWPTVANAADHYLAIDDEPAYAAMRLLAGSGIAAGESGAAALGALLAVVDPQDREALGLRADATVLLVNTEGATDPVNYLAQVGSSADDVLAGAAARRSAAGVAAM
ncbi:diaminopropionate ammonia-lyase [Arthrobacter sp. 35W]|uniref:diaminopropionate ammonia-lyase n=1 Tax=Arthrobacter sp. 35W TaxID=1132441 RepID=UPI00041C6872|nr:diaminopropionate ammonia-lyase [Arthrobacter sp. 35W]